jgi:hypothetical protein
LAVYTCLDMIRDCRENRKEGWIFLIQNHVPFLRQLLAQYYADRAGDLELLNRVLKTLHNPASELYQKPGPTSEREFLVHLRQVALAAVETDKASTAPEIPLDLETLTEAFGPLTVVERQLAWLETMGYDAVATGKLMNAAVETVDKVREKADELLRLKLDSWRRRMLEENGVVLRQLAAVPRGENCLAIKSYLDAIDGRMTWARKHEDEFHMSECWHCVDHFCRVREADLLLQTSKALNHDEAEPFYKMMGVQPDKPSLWKRFVGA